MESDHSLSLGLSVGPQFPAEAPRGLNSDPSHGEKNDPIKREAGVLEAQLNQVTAENRRLSEILSTMFVNYSTLRNQFLDHVRMTSEKVCDSPTRKRKSDSETNCQDDGSSCQINGNGNPIDSTWSDDSCKRIREDLKTDVTRVFVRTDPSDTSLVVKDGYQWRKYGQKVTRDNPSPRAYFKCSFAPACPVKKKVQRSPEDTTIIVATYEGKHTHGRPGHADAPSASCHNGSLPCSVSINSSGPAIIHDLPLPGSHHDAGKACCEMESPEFRRLLVEQMASSLANDPGFTAALATAISGRILQLSPAKD